MIGPEREKWHVSKEIPLVLVVSIMASVTTGIWYAAITSARISAIEESLRTSGTMRDDFIALKEQMKNVERTLVRMETILDRRADPQKTDRYGSNG